MKVIFEFDTDGLPMFETVASGPEKGVEIENLCSFFHDQLVCGTLEKTLHYMADHTAETDGPEIYKETMRIYREEEELARRVMKGMRIEP